MSLTVAKNWVTKNYTTNWFLKVKFPSLCFLQNWRWSNQTASQVKGRNLWCEIMILIRAHVAKEYQRLSVNDLSIPSIHYAWLLNVHNYKHQNQKKKLDRVCETLGISSIHLQVHYDLYLIKRWRAEKIASMLDNY